MKLDRGADRRVHVNKAKDWGQAAGTDFWAVFGDVAQVEAATLGDLDLYGWETDTVAFVAGSDADFISSADVGVTGGVTTATEDDFLISPFIFGDYAHSLMVEALLGYPPTSLNMECYARFSANADENASGFGWVEEGGGGGVLADADLLAFIGNGGTEFELNQGDGTVDAGDTDDTDSHLFKIIISGLTAEWFIDGTSQGSLTLETDLFPAAWAVNTEATGTVDPVVAWVHIWYE